jgi:uncharacterized protein (DUF2267 family)
MQTEFNKYAIRGNKILTQLAVRLGMPDDKARALHILKAVLHAVRNRTTPEESAHFIAQLPMMLKAIYVDGWQIGKHQKRIYTYQEFIEEVYELGGGFKGLAFGELYQAERGVKDVFFILKQFVTEGEFNNMLATMPKDISNHLLEILMENEGLVM